MTHNAITFICLSNSSQICIILFKKKNELHKLLFCQIEKKQWGQINLKKFWSSEKCVRVQVSAI